MSEAPVAEPLIGRAIPAAQLRKQILDLIDSVKRPEDMSRTNVERVMGVRLLPSQKSTDYWRHEGMTDAGWGYGYGVQEQLRDFPRITIGFYSNDGEGHKLASRCSYDLEGLADEIVARGYTRKLRWAQPRGHLLFSRDAANRSFGVNVQLFKYVQQTGPDPEQYRYCAEEILISAGALLHE